MTLQDTRNLGIEFERRLQTVSPSFKIENKIDTEDIYAFLNQFQKQYIDALYMQDDSLTSDARNTLLVEDVLRTLTKHAKVGSYTTNSNDYDTRHYLFALPVDYYKYIRSSSHVTSDYTSSVRNAYLSNKFVKQSDFDQITAQSYDKNKILRNPIVTLEGNKLKVISDGYTNIDSIDVVYIKMPQEFSILNDTECELPYECFETLVSGAVNLYINHLTGLQPKQQTKKEDNNEKR